MGASPRAAQAILRGAKVLALVRGRPYVTCDDIKIMAYPVLGHRLVLDFRAASSGVKPRDIIAGLIMEAELERLPRESLRSSLKDVLKRVVCG